MPFRKVQKSPHSQTTLTKASKDESPQIGQLQSILPGADEGARVILKVDCEGSEREIFQSLSADTLSRIDVILLERHHADILREITEKLQELAFRLLVRRSAEMNTGMLYAFRK